MTTATETRPAATWLGVLDEIAGAVSRRLAQVEEPPPAPAPAPPEMTPLHALNDRLARMQARLDQAEQDAAAVDDVLGTEVVAFRQWVEAMSSARRRLADWAARVG